MMLRKFREVAAFLVFGLSGIYGASVPHVFQNGQVVAANEINENFSSILEQVSPYISPIIENESASANLFEGFSYKLNLEALGKNISYQWYKDEAPMTGQTSHQLGFSPFDPSDVGVYRGEAFNDFGGVSSANINIGLGLNPVLDELLVDDEMAAEINPYAGDDRGGIAFSQNYIYVVGDSGTVRVDKHDLSNPVQYPIQDGLFSDLGSGNLYSFATPDGVLLDDTDSLTYPFVLESIVQLDEDLLPSGANLTLSSNILIEGGNSNGVFPGEGYVILYRNSTLSANQTWYFIDLSNGNVSDLGATAYVPPMYGSENWADWGISQFDGSEYSVLYFGESNTETVLVQQIVPAGVPYNSHKISVPNYTFELDLSTFTLDLKESHWYYHTESESLLDSSSFSEVVGRASVSIKERVPFVEGPEYTITIGQLP